MLLGATIWSVAAFCAQNTPVATSRDIDPVTFVSAMPLAKYRKGLANKTGAAVAIVDGNRILHVSRKELSSMPDTTLVAVDGAERLAAGVIVLVVEIR